MSDSDGGPRTSVGPASDVDEVRAEIAATRERLGDTVAALADKADVKGQVQAKIAARREQLAERTATVRSKAGELGERAPEPAKQAVSQVRQQPAVAGGVAAGLLVLFLLWRRQRRRRG